MSINKIPSFPSFEHRTAKTTLTSFRVIEALRGRKGAGVSELAEELDLAKGTVHKHLSTLRQVQYVVKEGDQYRLSLRFLGLGMSTRECLGIHEVAYKPLTKLVEATGETASFVLPEHGHGVYAMRISHGDSKPKDTIQEGESIVLTATASGKAILAYFPEERRERVLDRYGLPELTANTITDRQDFYEELEHVHARRIAYDHGEFRDSLHCVASPITDDDDHAVAAITVSGPAERMSKKTSKLDFPTIVKSIADSIQSRVSR